MRTTEIGRRYPVGNGYVVRVRTYERVMNGALLHGYVGRTRWMYVTEGGRRGYMRTKGDAVATIRSLNTEA